MSLSILFFRQLDSDLLEIQGVTAVRCVPVILQDASYVLYGREFLQTLETELSEKFIRGAVEYGTTYCVRSSDLRNQLFLFQPDWESFLCFTGVQRRSI